jgi:hypothetical protein
MSEQQVGHPISVGAEYGLTECVHRFGPDARVRGREERCNETDRLRLFQTAHGAHRQPLDIDVRRRQTLLDGLESVRAGGPGVLRVDDLCPQLDLRAISTSRERE